MDVAPGTAVKVPLQALKGFGGWAATTKPAGRMLFHPMVAVLAVIELSTLIVTATVSPSLKLEAPNPSKRRTCPLAAPTMNRPRASGARIGIFVLLLFIKNYP